MWALWEEGGALPANAKQGRQGRRLVWVLRWEQAAAWPQPLGALAEGPQSQRKA